MAGFGGIKRKPTLRKRGCDEVMANPNGLLTENEVVDAVCSWLEKKRFHDIERRTTKERGKDIVAHLPSSNGEFWIEAKGATSARLGSRRYDVASIAGRSGTHCQRGVHFYSISVVGKGSAPKGRNSPP